MNKKFLLKTWLLLALMVLGVSSAWADQVTVSMTTFSDISGNVDDDENISYAAAQGSASTAPAVYSGQIRVYQNGGTFTVSANNGAKINSITLGSAMNTSVSYKVDNGTESENQSITANETITVNNIDCTTVLFTCKGTDKNSRLYVNSLSVTYTPAATIDVTNVELDKPTAIVSIGGTETLTATITPDDATNKNLTWSSGDEAIATVANGVVTGVAEGVTTITATTTDGSNISASCKVTVVSNISVTGVTLDQTSVSIDKGKTISLTATVLPTNATNKNVTWETSNASIATVSNGEVTGVSVGKATITVTTEDGSKTATCYVTVTRPEFIFYESFDQNTGKGGNDGQWSGTVGTGTIITDNTGWSFTKGSSNSKCAKLGTGSVKGSATTPTLGQAGNLIVSFKAGAWDGDQTELVLSVNGGGTLSTETVTMANAAWTDYEVIIYGATAETNLTFAGTQDEKARFFLDEVKVKEAVEKVTVTEAGYATLCADKALDFTGLDVKAYKAAMVDNDNVVTFTPVTKVPAGAGVLLKADEGSYDVPVIATASALSGNLLVGVSKDEQTVDGSDPKFSYYVLRNQNEIVGFYKIVADGYNLKKGTAYLKVEVAGSNAKTFIGFDGTETAVEAVAAQEQFAGELYNLQGQRVGNDYKGIVIVNGKKVIR